MIGRLRPRRPALTVLGALLLILGSATGCGKTTEPSPPTTGGSDTATTAAPAAQAPPSADTSKTTEPSETSKKPAPTHVELAKRLLGWLSKGEHAKVRASFAANMTKALPSDTAVRRWWRGIAKQTGKFQQHVSATSKPQGTKVSVVLTTYFATEAWDLSADFDAQRKVTMLSVRLAKYGKLRPQTPTGPFTYKVRDVSFTGKDGVSLAGTLTIPKGAGPHPAVILISGSGSHDRDARVSGHQPFLVLADHLTTRGLAVLRYNDRGVGESKGDPTKDTLEVVAADAESGVAFLKSQPEVDGKRVGVIGHSSGGMVAPMVAINSGAAFMISLAGPATTGAELIPAQIGTLATSQGAPADDVANLVANQKLLVAAVVKGATGTELDAAILLVARANLRLRKLTHPKAEGALVRLLSTDIARPWYPSFAKFDGGLHLAKLKVPALVLYCEKDVIVPAGLNLKRAQAAIAKSGNKRASARVLAGLNHLFQPTETGSLDEYVIIGETIAPRVLELVATWLRKTAGLSSE